MKENKNMKIGDLKKIIANLSDDMDVMIPVCETNHKFDYYCHHYVNLAGLIYNNNHDKVLALYSTKDNSVTSFKDSLNLTVPNTVCTEELYPNHHYQLVTLRDYKNAGVFNMMPNGFNIYDYDILDDETDEDLLLTSNSLFNYESYLDCIVRAISPDPLDITLTAFYISTVDLRIKAGISVKEFENLVKSKRKA